MAWPVESAIGRFLWLADVEKDEKCWKGEKEKNSLHCSNEKTGKL
jgi:hypothetical protein